MHAIGKLFGFGGGNSSGKEGAGGAKPSEAIQQLLKAEEMLQKKSSFLEGKIEEEIKFARINGATNKRAALQALKRKRRYEKQLQQIDGMLSGIEFQRETLDKATTNAEVVNVMGNAAKALKLAHKNVNADDVHAMMDDLAEQQDIASEISDAISSPVGFGQDIDEDELEAELNELEREEIDKQLLEVELNDDEPLPRLPSVPHTEPTATTRAQFPEDDSDFERDLETWASS